MKEKKKKGVLKNMYVCVTVGCIVFVVLIENKVKDILNPDKIANKTPNNA